VFFVFTLSLILNAQYSSPSVDFSDIYFFLQIPEQIGFCLYGGGGGGSSSICNDSNSSNQHMVCCICCNELLLVLKVGDMHFDIHDIHVQESTSLHSANSRTCVIS